MALRKRILRYQDLPTFIAKIPAIYQDLSSGIRTNLSINDAVQLGVLALSLDSKSISRNVIDYEMVIQATSHPTEKLS